MPSSTQLGSLLRTSPVAQTAAAGLLLPIAAPIAAKQAASRAHFESPEAEAAFHRMLAERDQEGEPES